MITITDAFEHEQLELFHDSVTGLTGAVAIHSTALGPSMGGLRIRPYASIEEAAVDALRLARAMTLKSAAAGIQVGGGKAVLIDDGRWQDREARLLAFAGVLERLGGRYVTTEDVGTSPADMDVIATGTRWVVGRSPANGGTGDPSPATARTVFGAIDAAVRSALAVSSLDGVHVGVLGAGKTGGALVGLLADAGARVTVADVDGARAAACAAASRLVEAVPVEGFVQRELDVLAPCALGELIGVDDVGSLRCRIIAGSANNPLIDRDTALAVHRAGILFVPDFIANCGGIVHVAAEMDRLGGGRTVDEVLDASTVRVGELLAEALARDVPPIDVAVEYAQRSVSRGAAQAAV